MTEINYEFFALIYIVVVFTSFEELWGKAKIFLTHLSHFEKRNRIKRYGLPILLIIIVFIAKHNFHYILGGNSAFLLVSFAVALSSWYGGLGPGIFTTVLSAMLTYFLFLRTDISYHPAMGDYIVTFIFVVEGVVISLASEARFEVENQKDEFIGFVAHEVKNPLTSIKGFAGLIAQNAKKIKNEKMSAYAEQINTQSDKILEIINDLLDITKIEIGKFSYTDAFFTLNDVVREVISHQQVIVKNRLIKLTGSSKSKLYGDRYRIAQVITNLLTNAVKYSPETKNISVHLKENRESALVSVTDYGLGIPLKEQEKIFAQFYRAHVVEGNKSDGLGLGLFICNQIVKHHKGKLWVKSKEGKGSTFYLRLPIGILQ